MRGIPYLACLWTLVFTQSACVLSDIQFMERNEGESVVFTCVVGKNNPPPFGMYLARSWLQSTQVLFFYTETDFEMNNNDEKNRTSVSGDPSSHAVNVTLSQLRVSDTDRYFCEFVVNNPTSANLRLRGNTEFFLLVNSVGPGAMDIGLVEARAGGSVVLPCVSPRREALQMEGVILKRQRNLRAPVEVLYNSKSGSSSRSPSSSLLPDDRVQPVFTTGRSGITYNLSLQQLQPEDSGLYSCTLLLRGLSESHTSLGRHVYFVSVQGQCGCSGYSTLLYALTAAVAVLLLLLLIGFVVFYKGKARRKVKSLPQAPIYEEMAGMKSKLGPRHQEEIDSSEYNNCHVKKSCPENYYERPSGGLYPRRGSETNY